MISIHFQGKPFNIMVTQVYDPPQCSEVEVEQFYENLQDLLELTAGKKKKNRCTFHHRGLERKIGSQEIPGVTGKFGLGVKNETRQRLKEFCQENSLVIRNTLL